MNTRLPVLRLLFWPSLVTALISVLRLVAEVNGWLTNVSGGRLLPLGITWCIFVFGAWFGRALATAGNRPQVRLAFVWALLALLLVMTTVAQEFGPLVGGDQSDETFTAVRTAVLTGAGVATISAVAMFFVWSRLAWLMLLYALPARALVIALTWLAKTQEWDTHYTKFGPPGIERDLPTTMVSACIAQFGFWVPLTIVGGTLAGTLFVRRRA